MAHETPSEGQKPVIRRRDFERRGAASRIIDGIPVGERRLIAGASGRFQFRIDKVVPGQIESSVLSGMARDVARLRPIAPRAEGKKSGRKPRG